MPGLVPGIHVVVQCNRLACFIPPFVHEYMEVLQSKVARRHMDGRDEPGHDGKGAPPLPWLIDAPG